MGLAKDVARIAAHPGNALRCGRQCAEGACPLNGRRFLRVARWRAVRIHPPFFCDPPEIAIANQGRSGSGPALNRSAGLRCPEGDWDNLACGLSSCIHYSCHEPQTFHDVDMQDSSAYSAGFRAYLSWVHSLGNCHDPPKEKRRITKQNYCWKGTRKTIAAWLQSLFNYLL